MCSLCWIFYCCRSPKSKDKEKSAFAKWSEFYRDKPRQRQRTVSVLQDSNRLEIFNKSRRTKRSKENRKLDSETEVDPKGDRVTRIGIDFDVEAAEQPKNWSHER